MYQYHSSHSDNYKQADENGVKASDFLLKMAKPPFSKL